MNKVIAAVIAVVAATALGPREASAQKKAPSQRAVEISDATPQQYALLAQYKEMVGTIRSTTSDAVVLRVEYKPPAAKGKATPKGGMNSKSVYIDFELPLVKKPAIRRLSLGVEYDDKGNIKQPAAAKGADGLPGFPAKLDELVNGVLVKVYLSPAKSGPAPPKKKDNNGATIDAPPANRPQVRMIVVLAETNGQPAQGKAKKNK